MTVTASTMLHLTDLLAREESACDDLLNSLQRERSAIRRLALAEFDRVNEQRLAILASLDHLEGERQRLMARLAESLGIGATGVTLQAVIDKLQPSLSPGLDQGYARLAGKLRTVRQEIAFNAKLIDAVQGFIAQLLSAWTEAGPADGLYSLTGARQFQTGGTFVEQRG